MREACLAAGISKDAYYRFLKREEGFKDRFDQLMERPVLKARVRVVEAIDEGDTGSAKWLLERKRPQEFGAKSQIDIDVNVQHQLTEQELTRELMKLLSPGKMHEQVSGNPDSITPEIEYDGSESAMTE